MSLKILRIGDPHIKPSNLAEAEKLMAFVYQTVLDVEPDRVEILGDLFHTHAVVRLEVLSFWNSWLDILSEKAEVIVLVGNHDLSGNGHPSVNALEVFTKFKKKNLKIISHPAIYGNFAYMPYRANNELFIDESNGLAAAGGKVLICHQTFDGSQYENGFYAPDGVEISRLNYDLIISGHIHKTQIIKAGNKIVMYPGTAKWDTASDANESKGIWLHIHDDSTGAITATRFMSTEHVVTPIVKLSYKEGEEKPTYPENANVTLELVGSSEWVTKQKKSLKGQVSISAKITDKKTEKRNPGNNLPDFVNNLFVTNFNREKLLSYMKGLDLV